MPREQSKVTIKIPRALYNRIQTLIEGSGFGSPTEFIVYVLRDLVGETVRKESTGELSPEEIQAIRRRLQNLGYLD
jgi:Arc/MetJ-type ribon-helix-helix transcriptional regulator